MRHDARAVANYFLDKAQDAGKPLTPVQVTKLVYFAHGWSLGLLDSPLIEDPVEAWDYGPVFRRIYDAFKHFGNQPITDRAREFIWAEFDEDTEEGEPIAGAFTDTERRLMDKVWGEYGGLAGFQMSKLTHRDGTPWAEVFVKGKKNIAISDEIMAAHFKSEAAKNRVRRDQAAAAE